MSKIIFTNKEIKKVRSIVSVEMITIPKSNPQHRVMITYVLNQTLKGRIPSLEHFNQSKGDIEDVYKDLLELLGDDDSADLVNNLEERIRKASEKYV